MDRKFVFFALLMTLTVGRPVLAQGSAEAILQYVTPLIEPDDIGSAAFELYFERLGRWDFAPEVLLGNVNGFTIGPGGQMIALDPFAGTRSLYAPSGGLIRELDVTECEPGFQGNISKAEFFGDGSLLLVPDGGRPAFWFDSEGVCVERYTYGTYLPVYIETGPEMQLSTTRRFGLQVLSTDGTILTPESILYSNEVLFAAAADGLLYRLVVPNATDGGEVANPHLVIYRFKA